MKAHASISQVTAVGASSRFASCVLFPACATRQTDDLTRRFFRGDETTGRTDSGLARTRDRARWRARDPVGLRHKRAVSRVFSPALHREAHAVGDLLASRGTPRTP